MTNADNHGIHIRNAAVFLSEAINEARRDGYEVDVKYIEERKIGDRHSERLVDSVELKNLVFIG